jgi:hypothetical protein
MVSLEAVAAGNDVDRGVACRDYKRKTVMRLVAALSVASLLTTACTGPLLAAMGSAAHGVTIPAP